MTQAGEGPSLAVEDSVIHSDPEIMSGTPVFKRTRLLVKNLFDYLAAGYSLDVFLDHFPTADRGQAVRALEMARAALERDAYETRTSHVRTGPVTRDLQ